jgi:hypothetical protein
MEWETARAYLKQYEKEIAAGEPIEIPVFDHNTYERRLVKAIINPKLQQSPEVEKLWIKDASDWVEPEPWGIKVLEELTEDFTEHAQSEYGARSWRG